MDEGPRVIVEDRVPNRSALSIAADDTSLSEHRELLRDERGIPSRRSGERGDGAGVLEEEEDELEPRGRAASLEHRSDALEDLLGVRTRPSPSVLGRRALRLHRAAVRLSFGAASHAKSIRSKRSKRNCIAILEPFNSCSSVHNITIGRRFLRQDLRPRRTREDILVIAIASILRMQLAHRSAIWQNITSTTDEVSKEPDHDCPSDPCRSRSPARQELRTSDDRARRSRGLSARRPHASRPR